jgi:hypothetical protein
MTSRKRLRPSISRHFASADIISLKVMARPVFRLKQPLVRFVRCLKVVNVLSVGSDVRM